MYILLSTSVIKVDCDKLKLGFSSSDFYRIGDGIEVKQETIHVVVCSFFFGWQTSEFFHQLLNDVQFREYKLEDLMNQENY